MYWLLKTGRKHFLHSASSAMLVSTIIVCSGGLAGLAFWRCRPRLALTALALPMVGQLLCIYHALIVIEPINSWKPVGQCISRLLPLDGEVIFAASDEYQICGGLNFYSGKQLSILLPDGYLPPTYLNPVRHDLFITREDALRRWHASRPILLVIDPERQDNDIPALLSPAMPIGNWNGRLLLANQNFAEKSTVTYDASCSP